MRYSRAINAVERLSKAISRMVGGRPDAVAPLPFEQPWKTIAPIRISISAKRRKLRGGSPRPKAKSPGGVERGGRARARSVNATTTTICCCARRPSSTTTASAPSASGRRSPSRRPPICSANCCRWSTISTARSRPIRREGAEAYRRGVELIHRQLVDVLRKRGVRPIEALGADFDPHYHQAVAHEPAAGPPRRRSHRGVPPRLHARRSAAAAGDGEGCKG